MLHLSVSESKYLKKKKSLQTVQEGLKYRKKCEFCDKSLSDAYLNEHIRMVHKPQKDFKCESCDKSFTTIKVLEKHLHTVHD